MKRTQLTAVIEREGDGYVSLCPELDIASQGYTVQEAQANLKEAVELFLETADASEVQSRLRTAHAFPADHPPGESLVMYCSMVSRRSVSSSTRHCSRLRMESMAIRRP